MLEPKRQTFKSRYSRKSISVPAECPTRAIKSRLGRTHVGTPMAEVETMIREQVTAQRAAGNDAWTTKAESQAVRFALWQHEENRAEYGWVMGPH